MTNKKILSISLAITIAHFVLTSAIGHYIATQIGTQMGQIVASGISDMSNQNSAEKETDTNVIYQDMKDKSKDIAENWRIARFLLSLPIKFLFTSPLKEIQRANFNNAISNKVSKEQFYTRGMLIDYWANLVNSCCLGLLIYFVLRLAYRKPT